MFLNKIQYISFVGKANVGFKIKSYKSSFYIFFNERNPKGQPNQCTTVAPIM